MTRTTPELAPPLQTSAPHQALKSYGSRSRFVISIKNKFCSVEGLVGLAWAKAHVGIQGNELANHFAKLASVEGHGPFPCYLSRFKILSSPLCDCGSLGDPDHYLFDCLMTRDHHLKKPSCEAKSL
ncbi:hypothetical protein AVEN_174134-1 [Araneus ventricosus]|uniref:RNase H type-1 domain-containing protein n=1 Tax=Araneus ventricosus TaxID=182803 RepID=A0A4Y2EM19_ARAVE|nr:hypothetical protein AVEN_174134-1 [Araneus ventricosus]